MPDIGQTTDRIERELTDFAGRGGVAATQLDTGEEIRVNADLTMVTASTIKVPVLMTLFRQVDAGMVDLDRRLPFRDEFRVSGSGILFELSAGTALTVRDLATLMVIVSDNSATNMLIDLVGVPQVNQLLDDLGLPGTRLNRPISFKHEDKPLGVTSPADLAAIMAALATGSILSDASRDQILDIMSRQQHLDLIPRYLPYSAYRDGPFMPDNGLRIANKTGSITGLRADMALIEWPGVRYVIAVMIDGDPDHRFWAENAGERLIGRISRIVFEHFGGDQVQPVQEWPEG